MKWEGLGQFTLHLFALIKRNTGVPTAQEKPALRAGRIDPVIVQGCYPVSVRNIHEINVEDLPDPDANRSYGPSDVTRHVARYVRGVRVNVRGPGPVEAEDKTNSVAYGPEGGAMECVTEAGEDEGKGPTDRPSHRTLSCLNWLREHLYLVPVYLDDLSRLFLHDNPSLRTAWNGKNRIHQQE